MHSGQPDMTDHRQDLRALPHALSAQVGFMAAAPPADRAFVEQVVLDAPSALLEPGRLTRAWQRLAQTHETLRTVLVTDEAGMLRLLIRPDPQVALEARDLSALPPDRREAEIHAFLEADRARGVDPTRQPGWRVAAFELGAGRGRMVWTVHHALIDGVTLQIVLAQLWRCLTDEGHPLPAASGPSTLPAHPGGAEARDIFHAMLADPDVAGAFPVAAAAAGARMAQLRVTLPEAVAAGLTDQARRAGATGLNAVQAAWAILLARWTGRRGAAFGLVEAGRSDPACQGMAGCLIGTLPVQVALDGDEDLGGLLARLRGLTTALRPHARADQSAIRHWAGRSGAGALYDTVLMYQRATLAEALHREGCGWTDVRLLEEGRSLMALSVHHDSGLALQLDHDPARLPPATARAVMDQLARLLTAIAEAPPHTPLSRLAMLTPSDRDRLLALGGDPGAVPPSDLATRLEDAAHRHAHRPAVIEAATGAVTDFATLDARANAVAARLAGHGLGQGDVVAIALPRCTALVTAVLGTLKRGAAFLLLDADQEPEYLRRRIVQAGTPHLIAPLDHPLADAGIPHSPPDDRHRPLPPPRPAIRADALAYVTFTSGSTGMPKAVMGLNGALSAHGSAAIAAFGLSEDDRVLQFAAPGFDVALEEILPSLLAGAAVVLRDGRPLESIDGLLDLVARCGVTVLNLPASYWRQMVAGLRDGGRTLPPGLRLLVTGSERVAPDAYRDWRAIAPGIGFVNAYGPAETTVTATAWRGTDLPPGSDLPVGRPLGHARIILRAADGSLTPHGGEGEIWIGGPAVSGGYLDDPEATARAFHPDPWHPGGRLYRSGDLGRWSDDGQLLFLGRADRQIKLRGQRIELGQIESVLTACDGVAQSFVDLDQGPPARLLAWIVTRPGTDTAPITARLRERLPGYMIPRLIPVEALPVTVNGKIDRDRLPRPASASPASPGVADPLVEAVAACMAAVLQTEALSADDDFYDLGGDSLLALRLVGLITARTGLMLDATDVMQAPTPAGLVRRARAGAERPRYLIPIQADGGHVPIIAVHVLGRRQEFFRPLAAALGPDFPVMGLSIGVPKDLDGLSVPSVASSYLEELQRHLPNGPVCLIGVSMAAYFALELGQQLRRAGREVTAVVILDAVGPCGRPLQRGLGRLHGHLRQLRRDGPGHILSVMRHLRARSRDEAQGILTEDEQGRAVDMVKLVEANVRAVDAYHPTSFDRPIVVFRASRSFWYSREGLRQGLGWAGIAPGGWSLHELPGDHLSILEPCNVGALADHLRRLVPMANPEPAIGDPA